MAVALRSLKVDVTGDSTSYVVAMKNVRESNDAAGVSSQRLTAQQAALTAALVQAAGGSQIMARSLIENNRALEQLAANSNDAGKGFALTSIEVASTANHLKTAAVAAYALSPAFRSLVNPAITASVRALGPAAVAAGGAALSALSPLIATVGRLALPVGIAVESFKAMNAITELGAEKIKEFNDLAAKAAGASVGTDFFQRQAASAKKFGIEADSATDALKRFNDVSREQIGGSAFAQRVEQLAKAGNFRSNPGVAALQQATDLQSRYRAAVDLINTAMEQGQRLAALDLASKFLPPELLERLRASGSTLKDLQATADAVKPADIVDVAQIGYAIDLKTRLEAANETIASKFKPIQKDLTELGLNYQESWVNITELMAGAVTTGNDLYTALKGIPGLFAEAGNASFWTRLTEFTGRLGLNSTPESMGLIRPGQPGFSVDTARASLAAQLKNRAAVQQAMLQATTVQSAVRGDTSINPAKPKAATEANDPVDRAINTLRRHTEQQIADANAMGLGVAALARFRAEAAQTSAVQANGGKITADQTRQFEALTQRAVDAAVALERAKIATQISFGRQTALLSPEDVQIAQQLRGLYPDVATALASVEASGLRTNQALSGLSSSISSSMVSGLTDMTTGAKSVKDGFSDMATSIIREIEKMIIQLTIVGPLMRSLQGAFGGGGNILSNLFSGAASPASQLAAGVMPVAKGNAFGVSNVIPFARGGAFSNLVVNAPTFFRFANGGAMQNGVMGEAGPEAVMPLRRGPDGRLGVAAHGAANDNSIPGLAVNFHNAPAGTTGSASVQRDKNGGLVLDVTFANLVRGVVREDMSSGTGLAPDLKKYMRAGATGFSGG